MPETNLPILSGCEDQMWRFTTLQADGTIGTSTTMPESAAIAFARDVLASGIRITRFESADGDNILDEAEVLALCTKRHPAPD